MDNVKKDKIHALQNLKMDINVLLVKMGSLLIVIINVKELMINVFNILMVYAQNVIKSISFMISSVSHIHLDVLNIMEKIVSSVKITGL